MSLGPWFKCYPGDFLQGMRDMKPVTQSFYVQLIFRMYEAADAIYADERTIGRWCNSNARPWRAAREELIQSGRLVELPDGGLINPRALEEMIEQSSQKHVPAFIRERLAKVSKMFRESFGKDSRKISETSPENPAKTKPLKEPEPEPEEGGVVARARENPIDVKAVLSACLKAADLSEAVLAGAPNLVSPVAIIHLMRADPPCDLDLDVLPAVQTCAAGLRANGDELKSWSYCRAAIIRNRDNRLNGVPKPQRPQPGGQGRSGAGGYGQGMGDRQSVYDRVLDRLEGAAARPDPEPVHAGASQGGDLLDFERDAEGRWASSDQQRHSAAGGS